MATESYVVRVYRRAKRNPQAVVGIVEAPASGAQASFHDLAELATILAAPRRRLRRAGSTGGGP
jgi:hypothetical protein